MAFPICPSVVLGHKPFYFSYHVIKVGYIVVSSLNAKVKGDLIHKSSCHISSPSSRRVVLSMGWMYCNVNTLVVLKTPNTRVYCVENGHKEWICGKQQDTGIWGAQSWSKRRIEGMKWRYGIGKSVSEKNKSGEKKGDEVCDKNGGKEMGVWGGMSCLTMRWVQITKHRQRGKDKWRKCEWGNGEWGQRKTNRI